MHACIGLMPNVQAAACRPPGDRPAVPMPELRPPPRPAPGPWALLLFIEEAKEGVSVGRQELLVVSDGWACMHLIRDFGSKAV